MATKKFGKVEALNTKLNVVLDKQTINAIVRGVVGRNAGKLIGSGGVAFNDDHCCVDASVGSSAIGPVSTVGSSVSHSPDFGAMARGGMVRGIRSAKRKTKVSGQVKGGAKTKVSVKLPKRVKVR